MQENTTPHRTAAIAPNLPTTLWPVFACRKLQVNFLVLGVVLKKPSPKFAGPRTVHIQPLLLQGKAVLAPCQFQHHSVKNLSVLFLWLPYYFVTPIFYYGKDYTLNPLFLHYIDSWPARFLHQAIFSPHLPIWLQHAQYSFYLLR